jgi:tetratricopeptide (TPR) repeat protein/predicted Ser/Thr protein kinase
VSSELPPEARARLLADAREQLAPAAELLHGRYRLLRELGRGGMGVVYEAEDVALRRRVAVKRLSLPSEAGPGLAEPVLREARAAARLDHPNIAAVYDAYPDAIVMQLVEGRPLSEVTAPVRTLVAWLRDAARAVHHAHEHGIVHRDLKPHNLMVAGERVVVTDFGLAKELAVDTSLSLSGSVLGTPSFMPPEQAGGRAREVDARSDVYALGATLYDRLAGRPPFVEKDLVALLRAVVEDEPAPLAVLSPAVPRDLARVVHKCLEKEKARRYASAAELADDLGRWLEGQPVRAQAPTLGYRLAKAARRHRGLLAAGIVLALVSAAAVAWNWSERRAVEETLALVDDLAVRLENARALEGEALRSAQEQLDEGIARAQAFLARHPEAFSIEAKLGELLSERGRKDEALAAVERALALRPDFEPARLQRGLLKSNLVGVRRAAGESSPALEALRAEARRDLVAVESSARTLREIDVRRARAELASLDDRPAEAVRRYEDVTRIAPHREVPPALAALALAQGDPDEAFRQAMSAVDLARGFAPAYAAERAPDTPEEAVARAIRQHERSAAGDDGMLAIEGLAGRYTDWAARLAERKSTAAAYALRASGELRRAARFEREAKTSEALDSFARAVEDLGFALTIDPGLVPALGDRALAELERARMLASLGRAEDARPALDRARDDLRRVEGLAPTDERLRAALALHEARRAQLPVPAPAPEAPR